MARKENPTYRDTRRCATCYWVGLKMYGDSGVGHYCTKYKHRCCKTKVCDKHLTYEEYEALTQWPEHLAKYWADEPKATLPKQ